MTGRIAIGAAGSAMLALAFAGTPSAAAPARSPIPSDVSPAACGAGDLREPGIQGEVPAGQTPNYNCGVRLIGQLALSGSVAATGSCAYVRVRGTQDDSQLSVIDMRNPARP